MLIVLSIGFLGDRIGYRKAMIVGEIPALFLTFTLTFTTNQYLVLAGIIVSGTAGSPGAMRGAFSPGIAAYLARNWPKESQRVSRMGMVTSVASIASVLGSIMLYSSGYISRIYGEVESFRILYGISFILIVISILSLILLRERPLERKTVRIMKKESGVHVIKIALSNAVNGTGIGLAIVLLPAWFKLRFALAPSDVGLVFLWSYVGSAAGAYLATKVFSTRMNGTLAYASVTRILQGALMIVVALSPFLLVSEIVYAVRSVIAGFGVPNRTAINVGGISEGDFGAATSIQGISGRISQGSSGLSGYLMDLYIPFPLILGGAVQSLSGFLYYKLLKK
jgi:MFS family permease